MTHITDGREFGFIQVIKPEWHVPVPQGGVHTVGAANGVNVFEGVYRMPPDTERDPMYKRYDGATVIMLDPLKGTEKNDLPPPNCLGLVIKGGRIIGRAMLAENLTYMDTKEVELGGMSMAGPGESAVWRSVVSVVEDQTLEQIITDPRLKRSLEVPKTAENPKGIGTYTFPALFTKTVKEVMERQTREILRAGKDPREAFPSAGAPAASEASRG